MPVCSLGPYALAIVLGVREGSESEVSQWHAGEHFVERLSVPGFTRGRRGTASDVLPQDKMMMIYEAEDPAVFESAAYVERLNNPTPLTQKVMSRHVTGIRRTVCEVVAGAGAGVGGWNGFISFPKSRLDEAKREIGALTSRPGIVGAYCLVGTEYGQVRTAERAAREARGEADETFEALLVIEGVERAAVEAATRAYAESLGAKVSATYQVEHVLTSDDLA